MNKNECAECGSMNKLLKKVFDDDGNEGRLCKECYEDLIK